MDDNSTKQTDCAGEERLRRLTARLEAVGEWPETEGWRHYLSLSDRWKLQRRGDQGQGQRQRRRRAAESDRDGANTIGIGIVGVRMEAP